MQFSQSDGAHSLYLRSATTGAESMVVEVLLYVHRNRTFIRDGSSGRPPRLSHSS